MRILLRLGQRSITRNINTINHSYGLLQYKAAFDFAKISKKQEQRAEKKKQKAQAKQSLGGDISEIDLNKFEQSYTAVIASLKDQLSLVRFGRLDATTVSNSPVKIGSQTMLLSSLAQVSSKNANTCIISPFDNSQIEMIEKSLKIWDDSLQIKRGQVQLTLTQMAQGKQIRDKMIQKVKKLAVDRREQLKRIRTKTLDQLKKYKKIIPQDRFRIIQTEAKTIFDKKNQQIDKLEKQKEKQLMK